MFINLQNKNYIFQKKLEVFKQKYYIIQKDYNKHIRIDRQEHKNRTIKLVFML